MTDRKEALNRQMELEFERLRQRRAAMEDTERRRHTEAMERIADSYAAEFDRLCIIYRSKNNPET